MRIWSREQPECQQRSADGHQRARDAASQEDHQQPEHLASRPSPAHGDRFAHPHALDDDERADERQPSSTYVTGMSATSVISTTTAMSRSLRSADEDEPDRDADDEGRHDHDDQDDGADHEVGQDVVQEAP